MTKQAVYSAWASAGSVWSPWVKPVLFSQLDRGRPAAPEEPSNEPAPDPIVIDIPDFERDLAIVVDLPAEQGVTVGLDLAGSEYRPVPLYNACPGPASIDSFVEVRPLIHALNTGAQRLAEVKLPNDAPPVFLLDANRRHGRKTLSPGDFDNRSISLPTDFPSATFLLSQKIRRVHLILSPGISSPQADLIHTLLRWQQGGLLIQSGIPAQLLTIARPSRFRSLLHNVLAMSGLIPSPFGGFGGVLPMPSSG
jgi:hypothetical protein